MLGISLPGVDKGLTFLEIPKGSTDTLHTLRHDVIDLLEIRTQRDPKLDQNFLHTSAAAALARVELAEVQKEDLLEPRTTTLKAAGRSKRKRKDHWSNKASNSSSHDSKVQKIAADSSRYD